VAGRPGIPVRGRRRGDEAVVTTGARTAPEAQLVRARPERCRPSPANPGEACTGEAAHAMRHPRPTLDHESDGRRVRERERDPPAADAKVAERGRETGGPRDRGRQARQQLGRACSGGRLRTGRRRLDSVPRESDGLLAAAVVAGDQPCVARARRARGREANGLGDTAPRRNHGALVERRAPLIRFGLNGTEYEIDLSAGHAKELRDALGAYVDAARRAG